MSDLRDLTRALKDITGAAKAAGKAGQAIGRAAGDITGADDQYRRTDADHEDRANRAELRRNKSATDLRGDVEGEYGPSGGHGAHGSRRERAAQASSSDMLVGAVAGVMRMDPQSPERADALRSIAAYIEANPKLHKQAYNHATGTRDHTYELPQVGDAPKHANDISQPKVRPMKGIASPEQLIEAISKKLEPQVGAPAISRSELGLPERTAPAPLRQPTSYMEQGGATIQPAVYQPAPAPAVAPAPAPDKPAPKPEVKMVAEVQMTKVDGGPAKLYPGAGGKIWNTDQAPTVAANQVKEIQAMLGVKDDGKWGPVTQEAFAKKCKEAGVVSPKDVDFTNPRDPELLKVMALLNKDSIKQVPDVSAAPAAPAQEAAAPAAAVASAAPSQHHIGDEAVLLTQASAAPAPELQQASQASVLTAGLASSMTLAHALQAQQQEMLNPLGNLNLSPAAAVTAELPAVETFGNGYRNRGEIDVFAGTSDAPSVAGDVAPVRTAAGSVVGSTPLDLGEAAMVVIHAVRGGEQHRVNMNGRNLTVGGNEMTPDKVIENAGAMIGILNSARQRNGDRSLPPEQYEDLKDLLTQVNSSKDPRAAEAFINAVKAMDTKFLPSIEAVERRHPPTTARGVSAAAVTAEPPAVVPAVFVQSVGNATPALSAAAVYNGEIPSLTAAGQSPVVVQNAINHNPLFAGGGFGGSEDLPTPKGMQSAVEQARQAVVAHSMAANEAVFAPGNVPDARTAEQIAARAGTQRA